MNTLRYSSIYGSDNTFAIPRRSQVQLPDAPGGTIIDLASTVVAGGRQAYDPTSESNTIILPGVTGSASVTLQVGTWGTSQYSYPTFVGDKLTVIILGSALVGIGLGFFVPSSSPDIQVNSNFYSSLEFTYLGDDLQGALGPNGGWAMTCGFVDGWPLGF